MTFRYLILIVLLLLKSRDSLAQKLYPSINPVHTAEGLGTATETPFLSFSGNADIGIPLDKVSLRGLEIPITLRYNTNGVMVASQASSTGIGWILEAGGGVITRIINGSADEGYNGRRNPLKGSTTAIQTSLIVLDMDELAIGKTGLLTLV